MDNAEITSNTDFDFFTMYSIIEDGQIKHHFEKWGEANFTVVKEKNNALSPMSFFIMNEDCILYEFPHTDMYYYRYVSDLNVNFVDLNDDCLEDIIILGQFSGHTGGIGLVPDTCASVYFQTEHGYAASGVIELALGDSSFGDEIVIDYEDHKCVVRRQFDVDDIISLVRGMDISEYYGEKHFLESQ